MSRCLSLALLLAAGLCSVRLANAQQRLDTVPEPMRGIWVQSEHAADCSSGRHNFWILGPASDLYYIGPAETYTMTYTDIPAYDGDRIHLVFEDDTSEIVQLEGERLATYFIEDPKPIPAEKIDAAMNAAKRVAYTRCEGLSVEGGALLLAELAALHLSDVVPVCLAGSAGCGVAVFGFLDLSGDGALSAAELARGLRVATLASVTAEDMEPRTPLPSKFRSFQTLPETAARIVAQLDYDGSGTIGRDELDADLGRFGGNEIWQLIFALLTGEADPDDIAKIRAAFAVR
ncbi:hypothetical protein KO516_17505 [Citreicella sp. C3M06]|uniref:hypothetical protein n=1 Tax=Citreicella sp. C3M06 TaxID=2841564 RepID=UPI001C0A0EB5|nr:hypothetical protein [Citreicella sp. C3M06]MBU2962588.1 hypothetical protein [Citreicella sp. C3M06]